MIRKVKEIGSENNTVGDLSIDGSIDVQDALFIQKFIVNKATLTDEQKELADVNNDGFVDAFDAVMIQKYAAGKISEFTTAA